MPNKQNDITITIVSKGENNLPSTNEVPRLENSESDISNLAKSNSSIDKKIQNQKRALSMAASLASAQIIEQAKYQANKYVRLSENYMFENTINFAESTIKNVMSIGGAIVGGAMVAGPLGAVVGGSFALLRSVVKMGETWEQQQIAINESNYSQNFSATRLGLEDNSKNTLN